MDSKRLKPTFPPCFTERSFLSFYMLLAWQSITNSYGHGPRKPIACTDSIIQARGPRRRVLVTSSSVFGRLHTWKRPSRISDVNADWQVCQNPLYLLTAAIARKLSEFPYIPLKIKGAFDSLLDSGTVSGCLGNFPEARNSVSMT